MQLINEEDDIAVLLHLVDGLFNALLEFAPVLSPGDHAGQVQRQDLLVQQLLRHIRRGDALGQTLGNSRLAHAGLADQNGVILGAAGQNLDDPLNFLFPSDDRVQLALTGRLGQIPGKFSQGLALLAVLPMGSGGASGGSPGSLVDLLNHGAVHLLGVDTHGVQAHEQMLGADVPGTGAHSLRHSQLHGALGPGSKSLSGGCAGHTLAHTALQHSADHILRHAVLLHDPVGNAVLLPHQA